MIMKHEYGDHWKLWIVNAKFIWMTTRGVLGVRTVTGENREYIEMFEDLHLLWSPSSKAFSELVATGRDNEDTKHPLPLTG